MRTDFPAVVPEPVSYYIQAPDGHPPPKNKTGADFQSAPVLMGNVPPSNITCLENRVLHEHLDRLVFGHPQFIVKLRRSLGTVFGTFPELAFVVARKRYDVFLR